MDENIPLGDTRYVFKNPKYIILMKKLAIQNVIFHILVATLASLNCKSTEIISKVRKNFLAYKRVLQIMGLECNQQDAKNR